MIIEIALIKEIQFIRNDKDKRKLVRQFFELNCACGICTLKLVTFLFISILKLTLKYT